MARSVGGADKKEIFEQIPAWAPYREFPKPNYAETYQGARYDFRETIHWEPTVKTDASGNAKVSFYLNDAITSFRVQAEGVSAGGLPGRTEEIVQSKLPVSLDVKIPLEVSRDDTIELPVSLANETKRSYTVSITSEFGSAFKALGGIPTAITLKAGERKSFFAKLEVVGDGERLEDGLLRVAMTTDNLRDQVEQEVRVVALGFPQSVSLAGTVKTIAKHEFQLSGVIPDSISATLTMYPSPLATMLSGTEAMIREPYGCFDMLRFTPLSRRQPLHCVLLSSRRYKKGVPH